MTPWDSNGHVTDDVPFTLSTGAKSTSLDDLEDIMHSVSKHVRHGVDIDV